MVTENKTLVRRSFEEAFGKGQLAVVDEVMAPHWVDHATGTPPGLEQGSEGARQLISLYRKGVPDLSFHIEDQIAEGDKVVTRRQGYHLTCVSHIVRTSLYERSLSTLRAMEVAYL